MRLSHRLAAYAFAVASAGLLAAPALAAAPSVGTQAPAFYRAGLGGFEVTALSDGTVDLPVDKLLLGTKSGEVQKIMGQSFMRVPTPTSVNAYLVNTGSKLVMFDAGAGTLFGPTLGKLVDNLKAAGYQPEQVDEIYITHLHPDHVGGLAANGQRVFANAVVRAEQRDVDFWLSEEQKAKAPADAKGFFDGAIASLKPYADAGKLKPFTGDTELVPDYQSDPKAKP